MSILLSLAVKSFLLAGATLLLLRLFRNASASQRSFLAHAGLGALLLLPLVGWLMPALIVETALLGEAANDMTVVDAAPLAAIERVQSPAFAPLAAIERVQSPAFAPVSLDIDWALVAMLLPAALLLAVTLLAIARLFALRTRARVLTDPRWLSALAHAQQRMNFKSGAALLVSDALPSPVSWGLARPVILLSENAVTRGDEAEAIIAHELAHVASMDWAKLVLGRLVTAMFWFNPLVWLLARDAHQLREESADDAVLAANVDGADYAALLVHTARHDCRAATLAAHGVAPGRGSLQRRVQRVLDRGLPRTRMEARWAAIGATVALLGVAPLAALTFTPRSSDGDAAPAPATNPQVAARAVSTDANADAAQVRADADAVPQDFEADLGRDLEKDLEPVAREFALDRAAIARAALDESREAMREAARIQALHRPSAAFRRDVAAAYPPFRSAPDAMLQAMEQSGVDADDLRELWGAGYRSLQPGQAMGAVHVGVDGDYIRELANAGCRNLSIGRLTAMAAAGVDGDSVRAAKGKCSVTSGPLANVEWHVRAGPPPAPAEPPAIPGRRPN